MPLGVPMQQRPAGKPTPPRPMPGGSGGSQTAPTPKTQTVTVLPPNDPNQKPLSVSNPGPATITPPGATPPPPRPVVVSPIPAGVVPDGKGGVVGNYGLDTSTYDALQAAQAAQWARSNSLNAGLGFDMALAQRGNQYDRNLLGLNHMSDMARLGNSQYRDVDLARQGVRDAGAAAARMYGINSQRLADQLGFGQRAFNINSQRLDDQFGFGQRAFNLGMESSGYGAGMQRRALTDQTAAAGSASATGTAQGFTDIDRNLGFAQRGIRDTWDQVQANVNTGRQDVGLDWDRVQADVGTGRQALDSDWATSQADQARQNKVIDSIAKDYGVTSGQMKQAFKLGMDRLGLDYATVTAKFTAAMQSNNAQAQAAADALLLQVLAAAQGG